MLHFLLYLRNYNEFEADILDLQSEKYRLSFHIKKYTTSGWAQGDENVIGIRAFFALNKVTNRWRNHNNKTTKISELNKIIELYEL